MKEWLDAFFDRKIAILIALGPSAYFLYVSLKLGGCALFMFVATHLFLAFSVGWNLSRHLVERGDSE